MTVGPAPRTSSDDRASTWSARPPTSWAIEAARWWNGRTRTVLFVFSGLIVLQSSDALDLAKLVYLVLAGAVVVSAAVVAVHRPDRYGLFGVRPWLAISVAIAIMIAISLAVAMGHGIGFTPWLRGVAPYALFAVAPLVALDARRVMSAHEAVVWTMLAGVLAAVSFSIYWLERRQIVDLGIDRLVLPSAQLAYAGFAVATAFALRSGRPVRWGVAAGLILGLLLITGSRTTLLLVVVAAILAIAVGHSEWRRTTRALVSGAATAGIVVAVTVAILSSQTLTLASPRPGPAVSSTPGTSNQSPASTKPDEAPRPDLIGERLGSVGQMVTDPASGQSLKERIAQTQAAFVAFAADPWLGSGPGRLYTWTNSSGVRIESYDLDTPLMVPAKFGLLGILVSIALIGAFAWFIRLTRRTIGRGPEHLSVVGLAVVFGLTSFLGPPMDDKGAAYALTLVMAIALPAVAAASQDARG